MQSQVYVLSELIDFGTFPIVHIERQYGLQDRSLNSDWLLPQQLTVLVNNVHCNYAKYVTGHYSFFPVTNTIPVFKTYLDYELSFWHAVCITVMLCYTCFCALHLK
jgi:hypothetical protein